MQNKKQKQQKEKYESFKWFLTSSKLIVTGGKNAQQNEELLTKHLNKKDIVLHTKEPGSSFCIIKARGKAITKKDIKETAQFCACFSQQWKKQAKMKNIKKTKQIEVHIFKAEQVVKEKHQKTGTFSVIGKIQKSKVKPELWLGFQKSKLRAAPKTALAKPLLKLLPGKINKEKTIKLLEKKLEKQFNLKVETQEIAQAIPAGGFKCS